ncbi:lateral signaling target protein 2 homolog isoform X2 [Paramormyrops kingsleyae]|uniref:lateral signaling target protein 2 homolog isoform X2 n=1 Tax=Paramormyrops kingsleyae TaxID=1676925 RepID=UPI000CD64081|nr:lateral signaling target protein 2 homolog isoform X2 [Paramormyrops kingsleyae]
MLSSLMKRWLYRPKRSDSRPLAQFFFADEEVNRITAELNGLDLRKDPQKYLVLLNQLRQSQDNMLRSIELVMEDYLAGQRCSRDYYIKFPDEIRQENLGVQLWFAAECLSAGSFLEVRESEGQLLRPLAEQLLRCLEEARHQLREQSVSGMQGCPAALRSTLLRYDSVFSQFELSYISTVMPVKSAEELQKQQEIVVLFCETVDRALKLGYITQDLIDGYEPLVMFTIPRLAIICGLLIFPDGPLNLQQGSENMSSLFRPFFTLLQKIRDLLRVLTKEELSILERRLCTTESGGHPCGEDPQLLPGADTEEQYEGSVQEPLCSPHECPSPFRSSVTQSNVAMGIAHDTLASRQRTTSGLQYPCSDNDLFPGMSSAQPGCDLPEHRQPPPVAFAASAAPCTVPPRAACGDVPGSELWMAPGVDVTPHVGEHSDYTHAPPEVDLSASAMDVCEPLHRWRQNWRGQSWHPKHSCPGTASRCPGREGRRLRGGQQDTERLPGGRDAMRVALRARYSSSSDMIHRLFVCISGVADQLQTNFASDMRAILKCVFELIVSRNDSESEGVKKDKRPEEEDCNSTQEECELCEDFNGGESRGDSAGGLPVWVPDNECTHCTACKAPFTFLRRRHHCRCCGKIFCGRCSSKEAPLPQFGQIQPVRVCNHCFYFHVVGETTQL